MVNDNFTVTKISRNVHLVEVKGNNTRYAALSDIHWDNPKCNWEKLKKHLDYCKENRIPVHINGDFFCLMQGKGDPRRNKSEIRPEHNNAKYLDSVVETAVEWFKPYAEILTIIGYGNHETGIIKHQETDILQRFVDLLNYTCKTNVQTGGYGGWHKERNAPPKVVGGRILTFDLIRTTKNKLSSYELLVDSIKFPI